MGLQFLFIHLIRVYYFHTDAISTSRGFSVFLADNFSQITVVLSPAVVSGHAVLENPHNLLIQLVVGVHPYIDCFISAIQINIAIQRVVIPKGQRTRWKVPRIS